MSTKKDTRDRSKAGKLEADREKRCAALLEKEGSETPLPDADALKNKSERWKDVDYTNVHNLKKIITALALTDLPTKSAFLALGGKGDNRTALHGYLRFLFEDLASGKRKTKDALDKEERKKRGECDLLFAELEQPAREAEWRAVLFKDGKVTMPSKTFEARAGNTNNCQAFWNALKAEERAAKCTKAEADGKVREMTREITLPDAFKPGQPNDGAMPFGAGVDEMSGAWSIGDEASDYARSVVEKAATRRGVSLDDMGVDVAHFLLKTTSSRELKLRRHGMDNIGRSVTKAVTTIRDLGLLGVWAGERCSSRLVAELRIAATRDAPEVSALGDSNRCDVRACLAACGDAPSVGFGAAAGGVLGGGAASRGGLRLGRVGAARLRAAAVSTSAPASLGAALTDCDWAEKVLDRASRLRFAPRERVVTAMTDADSAAVSLDPKSPTFLVELARGASRNLDDVPAIRRVLDERELHETPGGEAGLVLLDYGLMKIDPLTGKGVAGDFIETCEEIDAEKTDSGRPCKFYAPKIMHYALQKALLSGKLHFERDILTLYYCLFGKRFYARLFYAGGITMLMARDMGFDTTLVPLVVPVEDLPKLEPWVAERFPNGISFESFDDVRKILSATNDLFFDEGKCFLWALAFAAYYGAGHPRARAALAAVAGFKDDRDRAALRLAACEKAIDALATDGDAGVSAVGAGACGDVLAAADGAAAPTYVFPSLKAALDAAKTPLTFKFRYAKPAKGPGEPRMSEWCDVDDLVPFCEVALATKSWDTIRSRHSWVFETATYRAMEAAACASSAVFAGMRLTEIAPPESVAYVFDPTKECKHDQTYTIWAGVDFEIMLPGGRVISKSEFLLQELEKHMTARA